MKIESLDLTDATVVHQSLTRFIDSFNGDRLAELVEQHRRPNFVFPRGRFRVVTPLSVRRDYTEGTVLNDYGETENFATIEEGQETFLMGGDGVVLGFEQDQRETLWLAKLSFSRGLYVDEAFPKPYPYRIYRDERDETFWRQRRKPILDVPLPVIIQLEEMGDDLEKMRLLEGLEWNKVLVESMTRWAASEDIPMVYILPDEMDWSTNPMFLYGQTAQELGFIRQPNRLWGLGLA